MGAGELRTRLTFGPAMLAGIALVYWLDSTRTGGLLTASLLGVVSVAGVGEFVAMMRRSGHAVGGTLLILFTVLLAGSAFFFRGWEELDRELYPLAIGTIALLFPIATRSLAADRLRQGLEEQGATLLGFVWIAWPMYLAQGMAIRHLPAVMFVVLVCKGGDIGAYFVGIALGRRRLIPHVSAGKTVEGTLGGVVFSALIAVLLAPSLLPAGGVGLTGALSIGIMLSVTAQIGDLVESALKRSCGVKDSSRLLPAHGGVLDLVDSLLFSFPAFFLLLVAIT